MKNSVCFEYGWNDFVKSIENDRYFIGLATAGCDAFRTNSNESHPAETAFNWFYENYYREFYLQIKEPSDQYIKYLKSQSSSIKNNFFE